MKQILQSKAVLEHAQGCCIKKRNVKPVIASKSQFKISKFKQNMSIVAVSAVLLQF